MKKMTKLFALIAAMALAFSFVACSNSNSDNSDSVTEVESIEKNISMHFKACSGSNNLSDRCNGI